MSTFFKEIAWWNMWRADVANARKATNPAERYAFCQAAMRDQKEFLCLEAEYWSSIRPEAQ